jgi:hypothetical protein
MVPMLSSKRAASSNHRATLRCIAYATKTSIQLPRWERGQYDGLYSQGAGRSQLKPPCRPRASLEQCVCCGGAPTIAFENNRLTPNDLFLARNVVCAFIARCSISCVAGQYLLDLRWPSFKVSFARLQELTRPKLFDTSHLPWTDSARNLLIALATPHFIPEAMSFSVTASRTSN